jgi:hypothetical protein
VSGQRRPWGNLQDDLLRELYASMPTIALAVALDRPLRAVYFRARRLGLRKSPEYLSSAYGGRLDGVKGSVTRFTKGMTPWNKGCKGWKAGGRSAETRFAKGRPAHEARNYRPIGSLRINKDGYLERKVTDDPTLVPARRWVAVHRLVWEAAHGPAPAGYAVTFKPGRRTTDEAAITLDAVELTSRADLMRRNTVHNLPPEVTQLIQLRGALNRKIRNRTREEQDAARP